MKTIILFLIALNLYSQEQIRISGSLDEDLDMSAISCFRNLCLLASDETNHLQVAKFENKTLKILNKKIELGKFKKENDIEALANDGYYFYAVGSHGLSRKSGKYQASRYTFFRIRFDNQGNTLEIIQKSLHDVITLNKGLKKYFKKPLQENGVNIEGLGVSGGKVYVGYRSPIINGKAQAQSFDVKKFFENDKIVDYKHHTFDLEGDGIRSMEFYVDKFVIISGSSKPAGANQAHLYVASNDLYKFDVPYPNLKLEGMEFIAPSKFIFIYDSEPQGSPIIFDIKDLKFSR